MAARIVWLATGLVLAACSLIRLGHPDYWDPVTSFDYLAVWSWSLAWILLGLAVAFVGRIAPAGTVRRISTVVAVASIATGIANGIEDGLGQRAWGTVYVVGSLTAWFGLLVLGAALFGEGLRRLGIAVAAIFGLLFLGAAESAVSIAAAVATIGIFGGLALRPAWFTIRHTPSTTGQVPAAPAG